MIVMFLLFNFLDISLMECKMKASNFQKNIYSTIQDLMVKDFELQS
jgi:hypothetical protein